MNVSPLTVLSSQDSLLYLQAPTAWVDGVDKITVNVKVGYSTNRYITEITQRNQKDTNIRRLLTKRINSSIGYLLCDIYILDDWVRDKQALWYIYN